VPLNFVIPSFAEGILQIRRKGKKKGLRGIDKVQIFFRNGVIPLLLSHQTLNPSIRFGILPDEGRFLPVDQAFGNKEDVFHTLGFSYASSQTVLIHSLAT